LDADIGSSAAFLYSCCFYPKAKPKDPFLKKYCNPKKIQGLELQQIKTYGRQILEVRGI
jgi:hypothetical protein